MSEPFDDCIAFVLAREGGYVNDPRDPGGETRWGISKRAYPEIDIKTLSLNEAKAIYYADYWKPCQCDEFAAPISLCVLDAAVNSGNDTAIRMLQEALNIPDDGLVGPKTIGAAAVADKQACIEAFHARREAHYRSLSSFDRFGVGWLARNDACRDLALEWIAEGA